MTLDGLYARYNRLYFGGKLPKIGLKFGKVYPAGLGETIFNNGPEMIVLDRSIRKFGRITRIVLLHEMAHASLPVDVLHGPKHQRALAKLFRQGAYKGLL